MGLLKGGDRVQRDRVLVVFRRIEETWEEDLRAAGAVLEAELADFEASLKLSSPGLCECLLELRPDAIRVLQECARWVGDVESDEQTAGSKRKEHGERQV